jgi:methylthioribose-1-phosphate isomerase
MVIPALNPFEPGDDAQLVLGNYTNVLSALGASIAAGSGVAIHNKVKNLNKSTGEFHDYFDEKHRKMQESFDTQQQKMQELLDRLYEMQKNKVELKNK